MRFYHSGALAGIDDHRRPGLVRAALAQRGRALSASWNVPVPRTLIQPRPAVLADVDPGNTVAESDETDNALPGVGHAAAARRARHPTFSVRFVPVVQSANGRQGNVTNANKDSFLAATMKMHPLAAYDADLRGALHHHRSRRDAAITATTPGPRS